jgi:hypothetical protein
MRIQLSYIELIPEGIMPGYFAGTFMQILPGFSIPGRTLFTRNIRSGNNG